MKSRSKEYGLFLGKFLLFATLLYLLWIPVASVYFSAVLKMTGSPTPAAPDYLFSQGIRSCIPVFAALVLATGEVKCKLKSELKRKAKTLLVGVPVLFLFRVILQLSYVSLQNAPPPGPSEFYQIFVIFLSGTCRVALPVLLWFSLSYRQLLLGRPRAGAARAGAVREGAEGGKKTYVCPFCGAEKVGIFDHIRSVHGEEALKSKDEKLQELLQELQNEN